MKKLIISFFIGFISLAAIGSIFANFIFLPKFAEWHQLHPDVVRATLDPLSGALQAIIQLIGLVVLVDRMKMTKLIDGAVLGAIYSAGIWLIVDLNMVALTTFVDYNFVVMDAVISAVIGGVGGAVVTWSQNKFA
ncbi:MAG: hypothetical protein HOJ64_02425 [Euryarchaeota archaeon]|jgi:hypothetical protein|nr:hypothetical protein [Euryarchaeota archaeon]